MWDALTLAYLDMENSAQLFELQNRACDLKQGELDVAQYFNALTRLWQDINLYVQIPWSNPGDAELYKKQVQKEWVYDFLARLNPNLDEVRGQLLGIKPLALITEIFAKVQREASWKQVMMSGSKPSLPEVSALTIPGQESPKNSKRNNLWCDFCKKTNHTKDRCWKLHGKLKFKE